MNDAVTADWVAETTPYERVRTVIGHAYTPISAGTVAERAQTTPKTARKHLESLAEEGFATTEPGESGGTHYRRSPESLVVEQAADILNQVSTDELSDRIREMRDRLQEFRERYGVTSPAELTVTSAAQEFSETPAESPSIDPGDLQEWQTTRRNLAFANAALAIATAEPFVDGETHRLEGGAATQ